MAFRLKKTAAIALSACLLLAATESACSAARFFGRASAEPQASAQTQSAAPAPSAPQPTLAQLLTAFEEIAFTGEYGGESRQIRKWAKPLAVAVHGDPTDEDRAALQGAMDGLNAVSGFPGISLAPAGADVDIWFVPLAKIPDVVPDYKAGNWGYFTTHYTADGIQDAAIGIATDVTNQAVRTHLIYEELLQSTGLMQDLNDTPASIFYSGWTTVQQPLPMDWELLGLLYRPELKPGMPEAQAMAALRSIDLPGPEVTSQAANSGELR